MFVFFFTSPSFSPFLGLWGAQLPQTSVPPTFSLGGEIKTYEEECELGAGIGASAWLWNISDSKPFCQ